jgi:uncharacterized protein
VVYIAFNKYNRGSMLIALNNIKDDKPIEIRGSEADSYIAQALSDLGAAHKEIEFNMSFEKRGEFIHVAGAFLGIFSMTCVRCLENFDQQISNNFRVILYPENGNLVSDGGEVELKPDDLEFSLIKGETIDPAQILREQIILSLPDYPLCEASCACGSCSSCKENLDSCEVPAEYQETESPFSVLRGLKLKH